MSLIRLATILAALVLAAPAGAAPPVGAGVHGLLEVEGKQVTLPAGEWVVMGRGGTPDRVSLALGRATGNQVDAAVLIQASRRAVPTAWGTAPGCRRTDLAFALVRYAGERDGSCAYGVVISPAGAGDPVDPAWTEARAFAADHGWTLPARWEAAVIRISDPRDAMEVRYAFPIVTAGGPLALQAWTLAAWDRVEDGFRNRLDDEEGLPAGPTPGLKPATAGPSPADPAAARLGHLGVKMVTYRIFGTLTDLSVNYFWLGSLPSATGLAVLGAAASSTLYFVHELVWSRFEAPADVALALPGMGPERGFSPRPD